MKGEVPGGARAVVVDFPDLREGYGCQPRRLSRSSTLTRPNERHHEVLGPDSSLESGKAVSAKRLRVAVAGAGYGAAHVAEFVACSGVDVVAVCTRSRESAEALGERFGVPLRTTDFGEILDAGIDAVSIATPPGLHSEMVVASIERGIHVLCEKPLAPDLAAGQDLLDRVEKAGVVHAVNFDYRTLPDHAVFHRLIQEGYLGEPYHGHLHWLSEHNADPDIPWSWRHSRAQAGFGVLGDMNHIIDDVLWNFGAVERVVADLQTIVTERRDPTSGETRRNEVEDAASFLLFAQSGMRIVGQLSRCALGGTYRLIECFGSEGMLRLTMPNHVDRQTSLVGLRRGGNRFERLSVADGGRAEKTYARFVAAIRSPEEPVVASFHEGVEVLRLTEAIRESSELRRVVELSPERTF